MFSSLGKYLFGENEGNQVGQQEHVDLNTKETELGWVFVYPAVSGKDCGDVPEASSNSCTCDKDSFNLPSVNSPPCTFCTREGAEGSDDTEVGSISLSDSDSHDGRGDFALCERSAFGLRLQSHLGESWIVTPPPCFTGTDSVKGDLRPNPLEDLLIEYPSFEFHPQVNQLTSGIDWFAKVSSQIEQYEATNIELPIKWLVKRMEEVPRAATRAYTISKKDKTKADRYNVAKHLVAVEEAAIKKAERREAKAMSRKNIERSNRVYMVQGCGRKHVAARNRILRPSGRMSSRHTQRH